MTQFGFNLLGVILLATPFARAAETNAAPDFKEVYDLVRQHLTGMADTDLNRAAVEGLFTNLRGKVTLVAGEGTAARTNVALVSKSATLENDVAYVRVDRVEAGLDYLISELPKVRAPMSLAWGVIALTAWDRRPSEAADWLDETTGRTLTEDPNALYDALLLLADRVPCPLVSVQRTVEAVHG